MLSVLICDDDDDIVTQVNGLLAQYSKMSGIEFSIDTKTSGNAVLQSLRTYDIAFVDIEMPGIDGLKLSEALKKENPDILVIVITSYSKYLDSAMKMHIFRYISKPLDPQRIIRNLYDAVQANRSISKTIIVEAKDSTHYIKTKDILYTENKKYGSVIVTKRGVLNTSKKPSEWFSIINQPDRFVYSHSSIIVNL